MQNAPSIALAFTGRRSWHNGIAAATSAGLTAAAGLALTTRAGEVDAAGLLLLITTCAGIFAQRFESKARRAADRVVASHLRAPLVPVHDGRADAGAPGGA